MREDRSVDRRSRPVVSWCLLAVAVAAVVGCQAFPVPDQSGYAPFPALATSDEAVVRLYLGPIPGIEAMAAHAWFVTKSAGDGTVDRWEVETFSREDVQYDGDGESWGHVWKNLRPDADGWVGDERYIFAELRGTPAEAVIAFLEAESPRYPCQDNYAFFPGPNCNTYAQWVLDGAGWDIELPPTAIGKDVPIACE